MDRLMSSPEEEAEKNNVCRVTHPASCESRGRISEHRSHTEGSLWGSLSSVGKQMGETDKRGSNECAQSATKEQIADLRFHGNQTLPGLQVSLLHFLLKSLRGNKQANVFRGSLNRRLTQRVVSVSLLALASRWNNGIQHPTSGAYEDAGDIHGNWASFRAEFEDYLLATGLSEKEKPVQAAALRRLMGNDCRHGSCPVSSVPSITILATQKKTRSLPVSRRELG
ncbi:hypothetical protein F7725_025610 [Dissostichus mawsoni]|uniref:Uncharacterized protein n=1 Tax=Dissostichus mawsoni TaxID=36200 RepID=A0A7J5XBL9_DISMA|nr:hypothetical protein F7725_025610 [Dissostichus mawsoni]